MNSLYLEQLERMEYVPAPHHFGAFANTVATIAVCIFFGYGLCVVIRSLWRKDGV